ncbi:MAG: LytTR family DNA-binding domain-containing protein [Christensenellales bacterium]
MRIEIKIDERCSEPIITVVTDKVTAEINEIMKRLSGEQTQMIAGFRDDRVTILDPDRIFRVFASNGKVYAETEGQQYVVRLRMYEMEQRLAGNTFVRISNSEIVNLKKVKGFDLSFAGTICVSLTNGAVTYVSRRYVAGIKQLLGI